MINAIPNPKKSLTIDFSMGNTKKGVERISIIHDKYKLVNRNDIVNQWIRPKSCGENKKI